MTSLPERNRVQSGRLPNEKEQCIVFEKESRGSEKRLRLQSAVSEGRRKGRNRMSFLQKLERKFGKYAIRNLTRYIIIFYVIGYLLQLISTSTGSGFILYLSLIPDAILRGQVWRLVSWVLIPPTNVSILTVIMLICYYQLGTILERIWGDFLYNFYIFFGLIMTVVGAFIYNFAGGALAIDLCGGMNFSTYYVSLSIFLGFAMTFPEEKMLLFFFIPIKIKYLAIFDCAYLTYQIIVGGWLIRVPIISSLAGTILFFLLARKQQFRRSRAEAKNRKRAQEFQKAMSRGRARSASGAAGGARHKCAICGQTELSNPELEFRYCSKCNGNYEYCQNHLFTHTHVK